ncbi:MAG: insulinase family protein [Tannerella sp.]|jgi:zinc protease|nr:insulinase family protein [Tannerella sp.]
MNKLKVFVALCCSILFYSLSAQTEIEQKLPVDPKIRYGKLPNGMTYYIRHNELPKERADFYIVLNVGSMQEEDNQRGLAHFLEHMAFNGSKNFPKETRSIDDFTESIGMRLGENLNAYTGFDETVYMLMNAPVTQPEIVDSCLLVLHDWSAFLALPDSMIEKERGIIREEWRRQADAQTRLWEQQLPKMYPGSRYAYRLPIGTIDVINNFKPEELRDYYRKWYRPDLQGLIVVGDIDVDKIEKRIKTMFSDIPVIANPAKRELATVPDNEEPLVSIAKDKESTNIILSIYYKHDKLPEELKGTITDYVINYMQQVIGTVMNERFSEIVQKANPPFVYAYAGDGDYMIAKTKGAWTSAAMVKPGGVDEALTALVTETNRVKQFGFTAAEYDRARTNILKGMESIYNEREKQKNSSFASEYVRNFTDGEYIPGIEMEYEILNQIAPGLPVETINEYAQNIIGDNNIVISLMGPDTEELVYPTENELPAMFAQAQAIPVEPYEEKVSSEPLISSLPKPDKIVDTKEDQLFGTTVYTLSNGVRVILKETDYKKDQVLMVASGKGGTSLFGNNDVLNLKLFNHITDLGGLGEFSTTQLSKVLTGKNVSCSTSVGQDYESLSGSAVPSDIRTLFELVYLSFTAPRKDEEAYTSFIGRMKSQLENLQLNPMVAYNDSITKAFYNDDPRAKRIEPGELSGISYDRIMKMYKERYADASDFVFTFVGNIDKDSMIPMMEQYLATLPSLKRTEAGDVNNIAKLRKGSYTNHFNRTMETPKASILNLYSGTMPYDEETRLTASILKQILDLVYMEKIRENESGSYNINSSVSISIFPEGETTLQVYFDTEPEMKEKLSAIVKDELKELISNGPRKIDFTKTRDNMLKRHDESMQENAYWLGVLDAYYFRGNDWHTRYKEILNQITPNDVRGFLKKLFEQGNHIEVTMEP